VDWNPPGAPPLIPILFITVACGAISGFHCLVGSGTTSKQIEKETHAKAIGYGSMLTEGFLAVLVIIACAAGLGLGIQAPLEDAWFGRSSDVPDGVDRVALITQTEIPTSGSTASKLFVLRVFEDWRKPSLSLATLVRSEAWLFESPPEDMQIVGLITRDYRTGPVTAIAGSRVDATGDFSSFFFNDLTSLLNENFTAVTPSGKIRVEFDSATAYLTGRLAFVKQYQPWSAAGSLSSMVGAFVDGAANLVASLRIPRGMGVALMGVLVASFAGTTMTLACRLQRGVIHAISGGMLPRAIGPACAVCGYDLRGASGSASRCPECGNTERFVAEGERAVIPSKASAFNPFKWTATMHGATLFAVVTAALLAGLPAPGMGWSLRGFGSGAIALWPIMVGTLQVALGLMLMGCGRRGASKARCMYLTASGVLIVALSLIGLIWFAFIGGSEYPSLLEQGQWVVLAPTAVVIVLGLPGATLLAVRLRRA
jgi:hypothetical protein